MLDALRKLLGSGAEPARETPEARRRKALELTQQPLSAQLLPAFEELIYHPGTSGNTDVHYQDREIRGAVACTPSEATLLHHAARLANPAHALEIGSYIGWSSAHLARALTRCKLTCVDPFLETGKAAAGIDLGALAHKRFLQNMQRAGVAERVNLVRAKSPDVLPEISAGLRWDFVFVDGWHLEGQPIKDVQGVLPHVTDDAVLLLHDIWIADARDAFLYLVANGWSYRIFDTANYLVLLWRVRPAWLDELARIAESDAFVLPQARHRKLYVGLVESSITTACGSFQAGR
jgi:predicted O-methyltransferase YrrM